MYDFDLSLMSNEELEKQLYSEVLYYAKEYIKVQREWFDNCTKN